MKFFYQILTTPTADTPGTTVLLNFPDKRYLFGQISEGTQRACTEVGVRFSYLGDIFLTGRTEWASNGGLIGVILTLADASASAVASVAETQKIKEARVQVQQGIERTSSRPQTPIGQIAAANGVPSSQQSHRRVVDHRNALTIHGGKNITHTIATTRRFVFRMGMPLITKEYEGEGIATGEEDGRADPFEKPTWSDANIKVWAMPIAPSSTTTGSLSGSLPHSPRKRRREEFQEQRASDKEYLEQYAKDQIVRQSVVTNMFNSSWTMDSLVEMPLASVKLPATVFIRNPETKDLQQYDGPLPGSEEPVPDIKVLVRLPWPGACVDKIPTTTRSEEALSYVVRNYDLRGKFDPQKAQDLRVPKGRSYAHLTQGINVQSEDGNTITPDMVLGPSRPGRGVAIIDLPGPDYVENLISRREWQSPAATAGLEAFLWILGPGVGDHPLLREFVAGMSHCKHIVSSPDYCPNYLALNSSAGSAVRLARLNSDCYSIPVHDNVTLPQPGTPMAGTRSTSGIVQDSPFKPAERGLIIDVEPKFGLNQTKVIPLFNPAKILKSIPHSVAQRMTSIRHRIRKPEFQKKLLKVQRELVGADVEIITLGTGSSIPSKYRNVSATLIRVPQHGYYLLDCGENTLGQLKRVFEPEQLKDVLSNLRMIWISHLHADHHLGLVSVIRAWRDENYGKRSSIADPVETDMAQILQEKRLFVVSEETMAIWLEDYASVEDYGFDKLIPLVASPYQDRDGSIQTTFTYRHCQADGTYPNSQLAHAAPTTTTLRFDDTSSPLTPLLHSATGLSNLLCTYVFHCRGALAASFVFPDGFKLSYSGDCRPSADFAAIGRDSTVLIHEATFQDDMAGSAIAKRHCTVTEALEIGREMRARTVVLTHFSQRYQKIARLDGRPGIARKEEASQATRDPLPEKGSTDLGASGPLDTVPSFQADPTVSRNPQTPSDPSVRKRQPFTPVAMAFDYMRLRVGDIPIAQLYAPAFEKLIDVLERTAAEEAEALQEQLQKEQADKGKKKDGKQKGKKGVSDSATASGTAEQLETHTASRKSAWSASESESGWTVSESEIESSYGVGSEA